eukprot:6128473-Alexandrium_andersonii.AAC.1
MLQALVLVCLQVVAPSVHAHKHCKAHQHQYKQYTPSANACPINLTSSCYEAFEQLDSLP